MRLDAVVSLLHCFTPSDYTSDSTDSTLEGAATCSASSANSASGAGAGVGARADLDNELQNAIEKLMLWCVCVGGVRHDHVYLWELSREEQLPTPARKFLEKALAGRDVVEYYN